MTMIQATASGDNTVAHVAAVSTFGGGLATISVWLLSLAHIVAPAEVEAAFGVVFSVLASLALQKISA